VGYLEQGYVHWDIRFFGVAKGTEDIRLVYDGTSSGINQAVWAPSFFLPSSVSLSRILQVNTYQLDMDIGEMFLNFPLHQNIKPYCGVNLTSFTDDLKTLSGQTRFRWNRTWMGFKPSPYLAVRHLAIAEELARGDKADKSNPFKYDQVILNLPCSSEFNPSMP